MKDTALDTEIDVVSREVAEAARKAAEALAARQRYLLRPLAESTGRPPAQGIHTNGSESAAEVTERMDAADKAEGISPDDDNLEKSRPRRGPVDLEEQTQAHERALEIQRAHAAKSVVDINVRLLPAGTIPPANGLKGLKLGFKPAQAEVSPAGKTPPARTTGASVVAAPATLAALKAE